MKKLSEQEIKFIEKNINDIVKIAKTLYQKQNIFEYDDVLSFVYESSIKATQKYDSTRNVAFSTFAYHVAKHDIWQQINKKQKENKNISIEKIIV